MLLEIIKLNGQLHSFPYLKSYVDNREQILDDLFNYYEKTY